MGQYIHFMVLALLHGDSFLCCQHVCASFRSVLWLPTYSTGPKKSKCLTVSAGCQSGGERTSISQQYAKLKGRGEKNKPKTI